MAEGHHVGGLLICDMVVAGDFTNGLSSCLPEELHLKAGAVFMVNSLVVF